MRSPGEVYELLKRLVPDLDDLVPGDQRVGHDLFGASLALHLEVIWRGATSAGDVLVLGLAHYARVGGELVPDPSLTVRVRLAEKVAGVGSYPQWTSHELMVPGGGNADPWEVVRDNEKLVRLLETALDRGHSLGPVASVVHRVEPGVEV